MAHILYTIDANVSSTNSRVQSKHRYTSKNQYTILNYEKGFVCFDDIVSPMYRSVVLDTNTHEVYAFSPPKSSIHHNQLDLGNLDPDTWMVNEIVEGSMVNLWYDRVAGSWEISTKNDVGGEYVYVRNDLSDGADMDPDDVEDKTPGALLNMPFIGQVTYKTMILDALCEGMNIFRQDIQDINDLMFLKEWDTQYCYSFVLQHPQNQLVLKIDQPRLYLVAVYRPIKNTVEVIPPTIYRTWKWLECIYYPLVIPPTTYTNLIKKYTTIHGSSDIVGVMMTNLKTGTRHKIVNAAYKDRKEIYRNRPGFFYQYLCLRYANKLDDFMKHSPMYVPLFEKLNTVVAQFMYNIYRSYQSRYMKRTGEIISHRYMPHVYNIHHTIYLPSIHNTKGTKTKITMQIVKEYLNGLSLTDFYHAIYTTV